MKKIGGDHFLYPLCNSYIDVGNKGKLRILVEIVTTSISE